VTTRRKGSIESGSAPAALLEQTVKQIGWLGSSTSRGLGQVSHITLRKVEAPAGQKPVTTYGEMLVNGRYQDILNDTAVPALVQRLAAFNQEVAKERSFYQALGMEGVLPGSWYFTVDLQADAFVQQFGLPTLELTPEMLQLPEAASYFAATEAVERGGWSTAWGLPLPRQLGIARGSVFLFRVANDDAAAANQLLTRLNQLEQEGIGADRGRGAGRLLICAPFHTEVNPR
jgi:CRISPR-associated Csx10 family RAMP protein